MQEQTIKNNDDTGRQSMRLLFLSTSSANLFCVFFVESIPSKSHWSPHDKITVIHFFSLVSSSYSYLTTLRGKRSLKNISKSLEVARVCGIKFHNNLLDFPLNMFTSPFLSEGSKSRWVGWSPEENCVQLDSLKQPKLPLGVIKWAKLESNFCICYLLIYFKSYCLLLWYTAYCN